MTSPAAERGPDKRWAGYYRAGAISIIIAGILVLISLPLIPLLLPSLAPSSVQSGLTSIQSQSVLFGTTWGIYLVSDLLYLIAFPALYFALRQANRTVTLIATIFNMVFVAVDVGVDIPLRLSLIGLSNSYASTNGDTRAAYLATGQLTMDLANLTALVATFLQFSAIILASYAMLKSQTFKKSLGYIGILSGVLGLLFIPTFAMGSMPSGLFNIGGFIFLVVWSLLVGLKLYKLG
ncbi:DUF4386 family protein [Candidatus Bathyarchaeota archaeon]|nr:MAG: DUF4386 family protein [Candidatus Bathyarchaeota archaeon]